MKKQYLLILLFAVFLGCDSLEQVVEIDFPEHEPRLVLNAKVEAGKAWNVFITKSRPIEEKGQFFNYDGDGNPLQDDIVTDGNIQVKVNNVDFVTLTHIRDGVYGSDILPPGPGSKIAMTINAPGFPELTVEDIVPSAPVITEEAILVAESNNDLGQSRIKFSFKDTSAENKDYYALIVNQVTINDVREGLGFTLKNATRFVPNLDEVDSDASFYQTVVFGDDFFDGDEVEIELDVSTFDPSTLVEIRFEKVSEAFFKFRSTIELQNEIDGNPFAEPVPIYSNVTGGLGVMSTASSETVFLQLVRSFDEDIVPGIYTLAGGGLTVLSPTRQSAQLSESTEAVISLFEDGSFEFVLKEPQGVFGSPIDLIINGTWTINLNTVELSFDDARAPSPQSFFLQVFGQISLSTEFEVTDGRFYNMRLEK